MLDPRLSTVLELIEPCGVLADIGTDHGYLPLEALTVGKCNFAIAADINIGPLNRAKETFAGSQHLSNVAFLLCDGVKEIPDPIDALVIAGMGAETAEMILRNDLDRIKRIPQIVLQVNKDVDALRRTMTDWGFSIVDERILFHKHYYVVIKFAYMHTKPSVSEFEIKYGPVLLKRRDPIFLTYLRSRMHHLEKLALQISNQAKRHAFENEALVIRATLDKEI